MPATRFRYGAPRNWRDTFITALAETSNISAAAEAAEISLSWVYKTRREDPEFARRWFGALCEGYDNLEMDLLARLREGRFEDTDADGSKRRFDVATALRCLTAHRESVAREKGRRTLADEVATIAAINQRIDAMRERARESDAAIRRARRGAAATKAGNDADG